MLNAVTNQDLPKGQYFQRVIDGTPISMLFAANGTEIKVIGFNQQWVAPIAGKPYRYGGIVGNANLPLAIKLSIFPAQKLASGFNTTSTNPKSAFFHKPCSL